MAPMRQALNLTGRIAITGGVIVVTLLAAPALLFAALFDKPSAGWG